MATTTKPRCSWAPTDKPLLVAYHDHEWGRPEHDDRKLFEMLILEGAQAGLSWLTILQRRDAYRTAFHNFDPAKVAKMTGVALERVLTKSGVIRNRRKVYAARTNARVFLAIQKEFGSFDRYLWQYVDGKPLINHPRSPKTIPASTSLSATISKDLKRRGMSFVGPTIVYAYLQAVGVVNDHVRDCYYAKKVK